MLGRSPGTPGAPAILGAQTLAKRTGGFTLIELLIVVVIIGILAAIAIPKYASTRGQAEVSKMKSDLRNLATAQESYFSDFSTYYSGAVPSSQLIYNPSSGVTIVITEGTPTGWGATTAYPGGTTRTCAYFTGNAAAPAPAVSNGLVACTP
ncbi:MAG: type II secretion system protein [Gemmatimonadales bacterium]